VEYVIFKEASKFVKENLFRVFSKVFKVHKGGGNS
jgi:hypothetical protein